MKHVKTAAAAMAVTLALLTAACAPAPAPAPVTDGPGGLVPANAIANITVQQPNATQASAIESFGEKLFNQTITGNVNAVISPLSAYAALGMAYEGAAGTTAQAFQDVMGMTPAEARATLAYLLTTWQDNTAGTTVTSANSAWIDQGFTPKQQWVDALKAYYQADVYNLDLQAPGTVDEVNGWINDNTGGLIPSMLDTIGPDVVALLVNALYLKADWAQPFDTNHTSEGQFTKADGQTVDAWYMSSTPETVKHFVTPNAEGVVLPYNDGRLAFVAAMPTSGSLTLNDGDISSWLAATTDDAILTMPKFHTEFGSDMTDTLSAMGLQVAMTPAADFSGIAPNLMIGSVQQKVSMDVGEKGTVAAAATVVQMVPTSGLVVAKYVVFDHPYVYAIVDQVTGVPLFIGAMDDPSQAEPTAK